MVLEDVPPLERKAAIIFSQSDCLQTAVDEDRRESRRESCAKTKTHELTMVLRVRIAILQYCNIAILQYCNMAIRTCTRHDNTYEYHVGITYDTAEPVNLKCVCLWWPFGGDQ